VVDEIIFFKPLLKRGLKQIIDIQLQHVSKMFAEKNISMKVDEDVKDFQLQHRYDVTYRARPLKRTVQKFIINPLSAELLMNKFESGDTIVIRYPGAGKLEFSKK